MIKAVVFDCGGVLHTSTDKYIAKDISKTFQITEDQFHRTCHKFIPLLQEGKISEKTFWEKFIADSHSTCPIPLKSPWEKEYLARFNKNDGVLRLAQDLKDCGYKIAVLSNTIKAHAEINKKKGLYDSFQYVILSNEVGLSKPDPKMFYFALNKLQTKPEETLFIDDKLSNIELAQKIGFKTILFINTKQFKKELTKLGISS
jgi:putative hydrolase of the HAD superfamily